MRKECWEISRTSCFLVRVKSRNSWIGAGGTKLERISPCASRSAIHPASFTSVFRPGTFLMCWALARISSKRSSSRCQIGFQYTPVASIATCVTPCSANQSPNSSSAVVVVSKLRVSSCAGSLTQRTRAMTMSLCTSKPAQRG